MSLVYKPDWEETKERYKAWWAGESLDRCCIWASAPRYDAPAEEPPEPPARIEDRWLDSDYIGRVNDYNARRTFYGGESFPLWYPGYPGWQSHACFLGAYIDLKEATGWCGEIISDAELSSLDISNLVIASDNHWWRLAKQQLYDMVEQCRGKAIPSLGAFGGSGDTLAAIRGSYRLLLDLVDCPDAVRELEIYLMRQWCEIYDVFYGIVHEASEGSAGWFPLWAPGKFYAAQNDFSYMISPKMMSDVFLPAIEMQTQFLDYVVYHVDGVAAFAHVDLLCELPNLHAFQILPGAGKPSPLTYLEVLRKVQSKGKNLHISVASSEVEEALSLLSARGLFIECYCDTEEQAQWVIKKAKELSRDR